MTNISKALCLAALAALTQPAFAADKMTIAVVNASSDAALFVADAKGYYKAEGIEAEFVSFDTGATMQSIAASASRSWPIRRIM